MIGVNTENISTIQFSYSLNGTDYNITPDTCTPNHFSNNEQVQSKLTQYNLTTWKCLPLNQYYSLGGL